MNWVARATRTLKMKDNPRYCYPQKNVRGEVIEWRYSDEAKTLLAQKSQDGWDPYGKNKPKNADGMESAVAGG